MSMSDPIADYLTRIRNGLMAKKPWADIPSSSMKIRMSYVLKEEKFIKDYIIIEDNKQNMLRIYLKYDYNDNPVIHGLKRISKPGCRNYISSNERVNVLNGMGIAIMTTSKGVMSNKKAKINNVGGEVLCHIW